MRAGLVLPVMLASLGLPAADLYAQCTGPNHVVWPTVNPVWDFCWKAPNSTVSRPNGAGLEISNVKYRGVMILAQADIPILNVKYSATADCGDAGLCYRDWFYELQAFLCRPTTSPGYCTGTTTPPMTVCQHPGTDSPSNFSGVAVENLGDHLKLTSQCRAGWYRYIPVWEFYLDGTIRGRLDATAVNNGCVQYTHHHHAYFRFDVDLGDVANFVDYLPPGGGAAQRVTVETNYTDTGSDRSRWRVGQVGSGTLVEISRNPEDEAAGDPPPVANDFPIADGWVVAYHDYEITDPNGGTGQASACPAQLNDFLDGEIVNGAEVVLWVRAAALHVGEPGGNAHDCSMFGPTIKVACLDSDGDGYGSSAGPACPSGAAPDCNDAAPTVFAVPPEIQSLGWLDDTTLSWNSAAPLAGSGTVYDVLRGVLNELPVGTGPSETCPGPGVSATSKVDTAVPPAGAGFWYLVRGRNVCGTGTYGTTSGGSPRTSSACP